MITLNPLFSSPFISQASPVLPLWLFSNWFQLVGSTARRLEGRRSQDIHTAPPLSVPVDISNRDYVRSMAPLSARQSCLVSAFLGNPGPNNTTVSLCSSSISVVESSFCWHLLPSVVFTHSSVISPRDRKLYCMDMLAYLFPATQVTPGGIRETMFSKYLELDDENLQ